MNGAGKFHLFVGKISVGVLSELLAENENAVQWRAEFVRHVCQELRLVFRRKRKLGGLFLQRAAGLLNFLVFSLDLDIPFSKLLCLLLELIVCLLKFLLLSLEFTGQGLGLFQKPLCLHRCFDTVEHDTDAVR